MDCLETTAYEGGDVSCASGRIAALRVDLELLTQ